MEFRPTITNEEINEMPVGHFPGRIVVVDSEETMREAERLLSGVTVMGYDTESRPSFQKGTKYGLALIQVATDEFALLFRVKCIPLSEKVREILSSPQVLKIGAALRDDLRGMYKVAQFVPRGFIDLQSIVKQWGIEELSVKKMAGIILGMKVSKAQRLTNWEAVRLTESQQDYAAVDAWVCREMYVRLRQTDPVQMAKLEVEMAPQDHGIETEETPKKTPPRFRRPRRKPRNRRYPKKRADDTLRNHHTE